MPYGRRTAGYRQSRRLWPPPARRPKSVEAVSSFAEKQKAQSHQVNKLSVGIRIRRPRHVDYVAVDAVRRPSNLICSLVIHRPWPRRTFILTTEADSRNTAHLAIGRVRGGCAIDGPANPWTQTQVPAYKQWKMPLLIVQTCTAVKMPGINGGSAIPNS